MTAKARTTKGEAKPAPANEKARGGQRGAKEARPQELARGPARVIARQLRYHEQLVAIRPVEVSQIAATLARDGVDPAEAIRKAYVLLDIALHCESSLKSEASVEAGISNYLHGAAVDGQFYGAMAALPQWELPCDRDGKKLPVPFDAGLNALIPLPRSTKNKPAERKRRFLLFVDQVYREADPGRDAKDREKEVCTRIREMSENGIPPEFFARASLQFSDWWERRYRAAQSAKGKSGQAAKKNGKGGAKSSRDKRKGARLPGGG